MKHRFTLKAFSALLALLALSASLLYAQSQEPSSAPKSPQPTQPQSSNAAQPQADKNATPSDNNATSNKDAAQPHTAIMPAAALAASKGCLAVKPIGSHAFRNIMLAGVAGALISKQQYKVMDVVNYPVSVGTKFHGNDLQTISSNGTKVVILDKHYKDEDLLKACH